MGVIMCGFNVNTSPEISQGVLPVGHRYVAERHAYDFVVKGSVIKQVSRPPAPTRNTRSGRYRFLHGNSSLGTGDWCQAVVSLPRRDFWFGQYLIRHESLTKRNQTPTF